MYFCDTVDIDRGIKTNTIMTIKGANGDNYHVTGKGQGNFNTVGAAAGIASLLGIDLGSILGNRCNNGTGTDALIAALAASRPTCSENNPVNRYELDMTEKLNAKESEIALLKADKYTDGKIIEAYKDLAGQIANVREEMRANKDEQYKLNLEQSVYNGKNTSTLACMQREIDELDRLTKPVVPSYNVCQQDCGCMCPNQ